MAVDRNSTDEELVAHIVNVIHKAKRQQPEAGLESLYVSTFRHWAPSLVKNYGRSGEQVTELRHAVLKELGLR